MLSALKSLFSHSSERIAAQRIYIKLVTQAREPALYTDYGIADTLDGRFDAIILHLFMLTRRLQREGTEQASSLARALQEVFVTDMDRSLREMGVGDTGVSRRIRAMAEALLGRMQIYENVADDRQAITESLHRNVYRGAEGAEAQAAKLAGYVMRNMEHLAGVPESALRNAAFDFLNQADSQTISAV